MLFIISLAAALCALGLATSIREPAVEKAGGEEHHLFSRKVLLPSLMIFFITFTLGGIITFLPLLGADREIASVGVFFTVFALTAVITRPLTGKLSDRLGRSRFFLPGLVLLSLSLVVIAVSGSLKWLLLGGFKLKR